MIKIIQRILLIFFVALISVTLLPKIEIFSGLPKVILVISLFYIFYKQFKIGLIWASVGSLFLDFLGTGFPYNILITTAIILLTWFLIQKIFESSNIYVFLIFCFFSSLIYDCAFMLANHLSFWSVALLSNALYTTLFGLIFAFIFFRFQNKNK